MNLPLVFPFNTIELCQKTSRPLRRPSVELAAKLLAGTSYEFSGFVNKARYSMYLIKWCPHCFSRKLFKGNLWVISFSSPKPLGLICNEPVQPRFKTTWPRNDGLWGREWSCLHRREKKKKCLSFVVQRPFWMLEKVVRYYTPGGLHASVEGGKRGRKGHLKLPTESTEVQTIYHKGGCLYTS